jgi:hypothetical protein
MGVAGVFGAHTGIQHIATTQAILPGAGCAVAVVLGEHLLSADGTGNLFYYEIALADLEITTFTQLYEKSGITEVGTSIQDSPKILLSVQLAIIASLLKVFLPGCQNGIVIGYGNELLDFHCVTSFL